MCPLIHHGFSKQNLSKTCFLDIYFIFKKKQNKIKQHQTNLKNTKITNDTKRSKKRGGMYFIRCLIIDSRVY